MVKLFFMRHCESLANTQNILASRIDFPLSEKGTADAKQIAGAFTRGFTIKRIISSPLIRAVKTALPFSELLKVPIETDERLVEQNLGFFSGKTYEQVDNHPEYQHDKTKRWDWIPLGNGESYRMIADRLYPFFKEFEYSASEPTLVVTHAVTMRLIRAILEGTLPRYPDTLAKNGEIWEVNFMGTEKKHEVIVHFL